MLLVRFQQNSCFHMLLFRSFRSVVCCFISNASNAFLCLSVLGYLACAGNYFLIQFNSPINLWIINPAAPGPDLDTWRPQVSDCVEALSTSRKYYSRTTKRCYQL